MPMIQLKITEPISEEQNIELHKSLTEAVVEIFHKPAEYVMVNVEKEVDLWLGGNKLLKGAYLSACLMGNMTNEDCNRFTEKVCEILKEEFTIDAAHIYTTFQTINQWGWNGKIL